MKILIKITEQIIKESASCPTLIEGLPDFQKGAVLTTDCLVSRAIRDMFPAATTASEYFRTNLTSFLNDEIALPSSVSDIIAKFDRITPEERLQMKPFSFEVDIPYGVIDQVGLGEVYKILSESKTLELVSI